MNANELADGILAIEERIFLTKKEHQLFQNSATMLRQQQAEIEALKAGKIRAYDNGVEDGRKPNTNLVKELSETRIKQIFVEQTGFYFDDNPADDLALMDFAKALLLEAQEK